jgi:hypothetical protein
VLPSDSPLWCSKEEAERLDRIEREQTDAKIAVLDRALNAMFSCRCCRQGNVLGSPSGLCPDCRAVAATIKAEQAASETINGRSRKDAVLDFLARQQP